MKMGGATILLVNFPSMEVSNLSDFIKYGVADFRISSILRLTLRLQCGVVVPVRILVPVPLVLVLSLEPEAEDWLIPL